MYKIERKFTVPIGHRLSKHKKKCYSFHGHNFTILVGVKSEVLDKNDMVMDFSSLDAIVVDYINNLDHCMLLNLTDEDIGNKLKELGSRVIFVNHDPTAEKLAETIYEIVKVTLERIYPLVKMDYVMVYENEKSKATYIEE